MTQTETIIVAVAIVAVIAAVALAMRSGGPRVTHVETRRDDRGTGE